MNKLLEVTGLGVASLRMPFYRLILRFCSGFCCVRAVISSVQYEPRSRRLWVLVFPLGIIFQLPATASSFIPKSSQKRTHYVAARTGQVHEHLTGARGKTVRPESNSTCRCTLVREYLLIAGTRVPGGGGTFFTWENTSMNSSGMEGGLKVELGDGDN